MENKGSEMNRNELENTSAETERKSRGRLGGKMGSCLRPGAICAALLLGIACFTGCSRQKSVDAERLYQQAQMLYNKADYRASTACLRQAAELGHPLAQLYYAASLKNGIGTDRDLIAAVEWLRKSADQKCVSAFYALGICYENGEGVERDLNEAETWYRKAVESGFVGPEALQSLERVAALKAELGAAPDTDSSPVIGEAVVNEAVVNEQLSEAERLLKQAQELFERLDKDVECAELLRQAAELGHPQAQLTYGRFLCRGIGTALDPASAVEWFRKAADQGCSEAFYELGVCCENGEGVERDFDKAIDWYRKAVESGFADAQSSIIRVEKAKALRAAEDLSEKTSQY